MTAEIINLRKARKAKKRVRESITAAVNRAAFGQLKVEKQSRALEDALAARRLDAHRLPDDDGGDAA